MTWLLPVGYNPNLYLVARNGPGIRSLHMIEFPRKLASHLVISYHKHEVHAQPAVTLCEDGSEITGSEIAETRPAMSPIQ